jgi:hypothetical protein
MYELCIRNSNDDKGTKYKMTDLTDKEIISQLEGRIKELEANLYQNAQAAFNVVKYFANKK